MIDRAREIVQMMGYDSTDKALEAVASGELILLKVPELKRLEASRWLRGQIAPLRSTDEVLAKVLDDIADGLDMAMELTRYPADTDICEMDLPYGWPSYCDKDAIAK